MKNLKKAVLALALGAALGAFGDAVPVVSGATMVQPSGTREVTITYTLSDAPAVVTLDIQTNATDDTWASIGGENVQNVTGDVWKKVGIGTHEIKWQPDLSWPNHKIAAGGARAVVTAWALDNTPDYMVVSLSDAAEVNTQKYYPAVDFLPGGLLDNDAYRKTKLVMRKIMAKDVEWTMGSVKEPGRQAAREATHEVTLTNNYYVGVFPVTQTQWALVKTDNSEPANFTNAAARAMRPVEKVSYNEIRNSNNSTAKSEYNWPNAPYSGSFLGKLRTKTGLDFDLPSEAQWEFAARAGNGTGSWGDGSGILDATEDANLDALGRYKANGGSISDQNCGAENGTAIVGSYAPNDWGLYDVHGNVWEWCLDWYEDDILALDGAVNINPANPAQTFGGSTVSVRVKRGGSWGSGAGSCRPAYRAQPKPTDAGSSEGFRVVCTAGLR